MNDALRYEWVRLKTLRSTWWLTGLAILASGLLGLTALGAPKPFTVNDYAEGLVGGPLAVFVLLMSILLGLIGVFSLGHEYRYNTIRPTLNALPRRSVLMAAKVLVVVLYVGLIGIVCQLVRYCVMLLILGSRLTDLGLFPDGLGRVWFGTIAYPIVFALCGLALAGLFRSVPTAIVLVIVMPIIAENIIRGLLSIGEISILQHIGKLMPFTAGTQIMRIDTSDPEINKALPGPWTGGLIFATFMVIVVALCWTLFEKRDA